MNNAEPVIFGENHLRIEDLLAVAQGHAPARLQSDAAFRERIARGAQFLDTLLDREGVIYGVTTGYGDSCVVAVPLHQVEALPQHLFTFHGCEQFGPRCLAAPQASKREPKHAAPIIISSAGKGQG